MRKGKVLVAAAAVAVGLSGCAYHAMDPGQQAVVQNGSFFPGADKTLTGCINPSETQNLPFDNVFLYPARNISWDARDKNDSQSPDRGPYLVVSSAEAPADMDIPVVVTFDLTRDCNLLKKFHAEYGTKYSGWLDPDNGSETPGWRALVEYVVGQPLQNTLLRIAQKYPWQSIWNDEKVRAEFQETLDKELPTASKDRTNGTEYFTNFRVTVFKPVPVNTQLKQAIEDKQAAIAQAAALQAKGVAEANAAKAKADADVAAAVSETTVALQEAAKQQAIINGYGGIEGFNMHECVIHGCNPYQPTYLVGAVGPAGK